MITTLDTQSWSQELVTGNGEFVAVPNPLVPSNTPQPLTVNGTLYVVSNVRGQNLGFGLNFGTNFGASLTNTFNVLMSTAVPPSPGPGAEFQVVAQYAFPEPNTDFDPVAAIDTYPGGGDPLLHIIGTRNTPTGPGTSSPQLSDLVKFTYNTVTQALTGPVVLSTGSRIRGSYDIQVLPTHNYIVGVCLADPILATSTITDVSITANALTIDISPALASAYSPGQWLLLDGLTTATFLNGALVQVTSATTTQFTAGLAYGGFGSNFGVSFNEANYGPAADTGSATPVGESLLAMERQFGTDALVPGSAIILDSSPSRLGNSFDAVSLVVNTPPGFGFGFGYNFGNGATAGSVQLYYQTHPKNVTFQDQVFNVNLFNRSTGGVWDPAPTPITTFSARWADDRLTVLSDTLGNLYMSQTYWSQLNHPEGIVGNALLGYAPAGGAWFFHPTFGTTAGGSIIQGTLSIDADLGVSYAYLLQPFDQIPAPPSAIAWPLHVASVAIPSLALTEVPGFYNTLSLTWIRGTKSLVDDQSGWAIVGETEGAVLPSTPTTVPVYVSLFNVPPIAAVEPTSVVLWRDDTFYATDVAATTGFSIAGDVATVQTPLGNDFASGQQVAIFGFSVPSNGFLNGNTLVVANSTGTAFTAPFVHADYAFAADTGSAALLVPGPLVLSAAGSTSPSLDPLGFAWTENYPGPDVTIVPSVSGETATLTALDAVGGPGFTFDAGVAVTDLAFAHPPANATQVQVVGTTVTFTINNSPSGYPLLPLAPGEEVMPYDIAVAYGYGLSFGENFGPLAADTTPLEFLNDQVLTVLAVPAPTSTSFSATCVPPGGFPATPLPVTGFVIPQFQFAVTDVTVPTNVAPTVSFPAPAWGNGFGFNFGNAFGVQAASVDRNTTFTITPETPTPPGDLPVVYTGLTDPDDSPTYAWAQTSGSAVAMSGTTTPAVTISTAGANILGETLTFQVTVSDGVNPPAAASFSVDVPAYAYSQGRDALQLSRSVFGLSGFGMAFGAGFGTSASPISQRNTIQAWSPLDISVIYTDLDTVKRVSVLDGSDRYIVISPYSVLVYGVYPSTVPVAVLLRVLLTPGGTLIQDAVHAEQDYTLVLDAEGTVFRYTTAPNFYTDAPDTSFALPEITSLSFVSTELDNDVHILTTQSFLDQRVLVFSGEQGALLLQVATDTLATGGLLELTTANHFLYGADKVQFVRWVGMEGLSSGDVLLGTVANNTAEITEVGIAAGNFNGSPVPVNTLLVTCANTFRQGDVVVLSGLTAAPTPVLEGLNGMSCTVVSANSSAFIAYMNSGHVPQPPTPYGPAPDTGLAVSQNSGSTYESLISLANKSVIGTWDKTKLKNQFVNTGEILFDPDTTYAGRPIPPILAAPSFTLAGTNANIGLSWQQQRPDLVSGYTVQQGTETVLNTTVPASQPYTFQVPTSSYFFAANVAVTDVTESAALTFVPYPPGPGQYTVSPAGLYTFNAAQAGDSVNVGFVQLFRTVAAVVSGVVQSVVVQLPAGPTYFFQVQATSLDGASGYSNIVQITT